MLGYEKPWNAGPRSCRSHVVLRLQHGPPGFLPILNLQCFAVAILRDYTRIFSLQGPRAGQSVHPVTEYETCPQPRPYAMSHVAAYARRNPCFSSCFGCAAEILCVHKGALSLWKYDMSAWGAADAPPNFPCRPET